jgi:hypothetical protein
MRRGVSRIDPGNNWKQLRAPASEPRKVGDRIGEEYRWWRKLAVALPRQGPSSLAFIPRRAFFCALFAAGGALAQAMSVSVAPAAQDVKRGELPRFTIEVRAAERVRIVDIASRADLRERLVRPRVAGRDTDDIPVRLSDLGPYGDGDYLVLEKGNTLTFSSDGLPLVLDRLAPGSYAVVFRYKPDWASAPVASNPVAFRVVP